MGTMFHYTNRKGVAYYLHCLTSRGGKVRYTMKRSDQGAIGELPAGYEVVENINAQVSVRRARTRQISAEEESVVQSNLIEHGLDAYRLEVKDDQITIFEPDRDPAEIAGLLNPFGNLPGGIGKQLEAAAREQFGDGAMDQYLHDRQEETRRRLERLTRYEPVLRFSLVDKQHRLFRVERMCYRGEGGWHKLNVMPLPEAARRYVKHLGRDSFFDLI